MRWRKKKLKTKNKRKIKTKQERTSYVELFQNLELMLLVE